MRLPLSSQQTVSLSPDPSSPCLPGPSGQVSTGDDMPSHFLHGRTPECCAYRQISACLSSPAGTGYAMQDLNQRMARASRLRRQSAQTPKIFRLPKHLARFYSARQAKA